jgi:SAM-dependent methyltransferase
MTTAFRDRIAKDPTISDNDKYYFFYMYDLGTSFIVPMALKTGIFKSGDSVAEIGSAEGGVLVAFAEKGAKDCLATDIVESRLEMGRIISGKGSFDIKYTSHDIIFDSPKDEWRTHYDLVLLRDVIEHLDKTEKALTNIKAIIKPGGRLYVTFPPYHSAFGGHQHTLANKWGKLPWIHLLPKNWFAKMISTGRKADIEEVERLQKIQLTTKKFEEAALAAGYKIERKTFYLLRPVFKMKFGLPTVSMNALSWIPGVKRFLVMEAAYTLTKVNSQNK